MFKPNKSFFWNLRNCLSEKFIIDYSYNASKDAKLITLHISLPSNHIEIENFFSINIFNKKDIVEEIFLMIYGHSPCHKLPKLHLVGSPTLYPLVFHYLPSIESLPFPGVFIESSYNISCRIYSESDLDMSFYNGATMDFLVSIG